MRISDWSSDVCSSDLGQSLQQFSTPLPLAFVAAHAASIHAGDRVLEPSAGTGMLAIHAELAGAALALNELADGRAELLERLFPAAPVTRLDGASIDDRLDAEFVPDVVLMTPPFSETAHVERPMRGTALRSEKHTSELQPLMRISYADF